MRALRRAGVPYGADDEIAAAAREVEGKTALDGLVAYVLSLGRAVNRGGPGGLDVELDQPNPLGQSVEAVTRGRKLWEANGCGACHGEEAYGQADVAPDLLDESFLGVEGDLPDAAYFAMIKGGSDVKRALGRPGVPDGGMQGYAADLSDEDIWAIVSWLRNQKAHEAAEPLEDDEKEEQRRKE
jgi:cytochrome c oxidase cbb3-type subunit 2